MLNQQAAKDNFYTSTSGSSPYVWWGDHFQTHASSSNRSLHRSHGHEWVPAESKTVTSFHRSFKVNSDYFLIDEFNKFLSSSLSVCHQKP